MAREYPVVTITGPRQSGKTTLAKMQFPDFQKAIPAAIKGAVVCSGDLQFKNGSASTTNFMNARNLFQ
ncbi:hypothetical protein [Pontiella sulfatireligans]|uniref:AAA domain-containing protein n=1 Tax=Pontiella sulfatireligans TaxID=2750658 RepID=A0A6C2UN52_9BACT|nr:hypothetical protein [Pontiella sulfatireligans]VGO21695.1 hypothetical protein SCARR_03769 [Pontiella sulfatireligans]